MEIVTTRSASGEHQGRRRRKASEGHVVAQLLDSPLPTPRRSCCGSAACTPRSARAASPQRTHVPFSWESSPGVPKAGSASKFEGEVLPPRPPPGRRRGGIGMGTPCHARAYYGNATTDATSSDDGGGGSEEDTFSDALDRLAALSARMSSVDGGAASRRLSSFIMDRFLPAANAIATTSTEKKRAKRSPRRGRRAHRSEHGDEDVAPALARRDVHTLCCRAPVHDVHAPAHQMRDVDTLCCRDHDGATTTPNDAATTAYVRTAGLPSVHGIDGRNPATPRPVRRRQPVTDEGRVIFF